MKIVPCDRCDSMGWVCEAHDNNGRGIAAQHPALAHAVPPACRVRHAISSTRPTLREWDCASFLTTENRGTDARKIQGLAIRGVPCSDAAYQLRMSIKTLARGCRPSISRRQSASFLLAVEVLSLT
jgi:hypothetical protein